MWGGRAEARADVMLDDCLYFLCTILGAIWKLEKYGKGGIMVS